MEVNQNAISEEKKIQKVIKELEENIKCKSEEIGKSKNELSATNEELENQNQKVKNLEKKLEVKEKEILGLIEKNNEMKQEMMEDLDKKSEYIRNINIDF